MNQKGENGNPSTSIVLDNAAAEIADDLLIQILLGLPLKPLLRFKIVSKHWLSLISSHRFCLLRNPAPNLSCGLILDFNHTMVSQYRDIRQSYTYFPFYPTTPNSCSPFLDFNFTIAPPRTVILHSCNGILLCCSSRLRDGLGLIINEPNSELYVYNPTTKYFVVLPHSGARNRCGASLVFDPVKSPHYKVVLVSPHYKDVLASETCVEYDKIEVHVYSSDTGIWTNAGEIGGSRTSKVNFQYGGVYWNGAIHWQNMSLSPDRSGYFLRYHVDTHAFHEMPTPPVSGNIYSSDFYFGTSGDHLYFAPPLHDVDSLQPRLNIYEMKRDYSEWFVKYQVDLLFPLSSYPEVIRPTIYQRNYYVGYVVSLVCGDDDDDNDNSMMILRIPGKILKYNLLDGSLEKLADVDQEFICTSYLGYEMEVDFSFCNEQGWDYIESICRV